MNANNVRDVDSICTPLAMQCLSGYALRPSFVDPAYSTAMNMAYQEINQHRRSLSHILKTAQQHNLRFNFDRTLEQGRIEELKEHICMLEVTAQEKIISKAEKISSRAEKSSHRVKERAGRSKRVAVKIPSGRPACVTPSSPDSSIPAEETTPQTTPQIPKRKKSSPSRVTSSVPEGIKQSKIARPIPSIGQDDHPVRLSPIPDQDDHLPIKKLKVQNSQGSASQTRSFV